jgi:hypothetical protein
MLHTLFSADCTRSHDTRADNWKGFVNEQLPHIQPTYNNTLTSGLLYRPAFLHDGLRGVQLSYEEMKLYNSHRHERYLLHPSYLSASFKTYCRRTYSCDSMKGYKPDVQFFFDNNGQSSIFSHAKRGAEDKKVTAETRKPALVNCVQNLEQKFVPLNVICGSLWNLEQCSNRFCL